MESRLGFEALWWLKLLPIFDRFTVLTLLRQNALSDTNPAANAFFDKKCDAKQKPRTHSARIIGMIA